MKLNRISGALLACTCFFGATDAWADTVAVMKLDVLGDNVDAQATQVFEAIRTAIMNAEDFDLDANGGDLTYTEMQMVTGCDKESSIACYDTACETLGAPAIVFGSIKSGGETHVVWYKSGVGVFREVKMTVTDQASADALASKLVVGSKGQLIVTSNVPGADVFVDGKRVGMSAEFKENATPIDLVEGKYIVSIRKDGFTKEDAVSVAIEGDKTAEVHINMSVATDPEVVRRGILIGGYTSLGVGAASIIAAGVLIPIAAGKGKGIAEDIDGGRVFDKKDSDNIDAMKISSQVMFGVGGFLLAAGVAMVVTGYVYDFAGEDIDRGLASNPYVPKIDFNLSPSYQGMTMGWKF